MKLISNRIEELFAQRSEISDTAESIEPKLGVQTPKNFAGDPTPTLPVLTSLDASFFEVAESNGFDPYNSGSFVTSKSRSGK